MSPFWSGFLVSAPIFFTVGGLVVAGSKKLLALAGKGNDAIQAGTSHIASEIKDEASKIVDKK